MPSFQNIRVDTTGRTSRQEKRIHRTGTIGQAQSNRHGKEKEALHLDEETHTQTHTPRRTSMKTTASSKKKASRLKRRDCTTEPACVCAGVGVCGEGGEECVCVCARVCRRGSMLEGRGGRTEESGERLWVCFASLCSRPMKLGGCCLSVYYTSYPPRSTHRDIHVRI